MMMLYYDGHEGGVVSLNNPATPHTLHALLLLASCFF
jgi:hypothetical protein